MKKKHNLKRVFKFLNRIDWAFELNNYERTIIDKDNQPEEHPNLTAEVIIDNVYKELTINLYPNFWECSLDLQRKALLHELTHTLLQNTKMLAMDMLDGTLHTSKEIKEVNERAVTSVTHLLDCLLRSQLDFAHKAYKDYLKK